ncbi:unnamed protein product, partial [Rotaria sp. Silwood2]
GTGSGKTSLLDILADRKDRHGLSGDVLINGQARPENFKYQVGYVVQDDILSGTLTVRENLTFSACIRLSKTINKTEKSTIVNQVIHQLGLEKCADSKVGTEFVRGISGGERKRTNIGMELVLSPSIIFFDEPTTDSTTARNVMKCLHELSRKEHTIIFSIHQPSYSIYKLFDVVLLLSMGQVVYHGQASQLLPYFSSIGYICDDLDNPADFILDVAQGNLLHTSNTNDVNQDLQQQQQSAANYLHDKYLKSTIYEQNEQEANNYLENFRDKSNSEILLKKPTFFNKMLGEKSLLNEFFYISQRMFKTSFRNPALTIMSTVVSIIFGILVGLVYLNIDYSLDIGVKNRIGAIFFIIMNQIFKNLSAIDLFLKEKVLFIHVSIYRLGSSREFQDNAFFTI